MTKEKTGRYFESGGHKPFRDDLVAWPKERDGKDAASPTPQPVVVLPAHDDVHAELARARSEVKRLLARIQELVEENGELRRAARRPGR